MKVFLLPPEMSDGQNQTVVSSVEEMMEHISQWAKEEESGQFTIKMKTMTREKFESLPDL